MTSTDCSWAPFDGEDHQLLLGGLDYAFLFAYAIGLFLSGHVAERLNLRYYLGKFRLRYWVSSNLFLAKRVASTKILFWCV